MIESLTGLLACPTCGISLQLTLCGEAATGFGWLACASCASAVPVLRGFAHFGEAFPLSGAPNAAVLQKLDRELAGEPAAFRDFVVAAARRPTFDLYAAFAPFNEATRALYPLIEALRAHLVSGDLILDLWCRTGWTGALLAGLFPDHRVVSLWEGPSNVLGFAGYRHWLGEDARPKNWTVVFADPRKGLPFVDGAAGLVHAADSLHRFGMEQFLQECLRVARADSALVFPHVHLANSEPEPFFDRGGEIRHGGVYRQWFRTALDGANRQAFVLGERALFAREKHDVLADDTPDYNALIAVLDSRRIDRAIGPAEQPWAEEDCLFANPLIAVNETNGDAAYDPAALAGRADYLLARHPVYAERLSARLPARLQDDDRRILYWARSASGITLGEIRGRLGLGKERFATCVARLQQHEVALSAPVGRAMARLQTFYTTRREPTPVTDQQFAALWKGARERYGDRPLLVTEDGSVFGVDDAEEILSSLVGLLRARGVGPDRPLVILAPLCAEAILSIWAAWLLGAAVVPLDTTMPPAQLVELIRRLSPGLVLSDAALAGVVSAGVPLLCLDQSGHGGPAATDLFADELARHAPAALPEPPSESAIAAILFTSGSTGQPKGVPLSQGALWRGAASLVESLGWHEGDVMLSLGGLHTMSGLRNPAVAALAAGVTIVLPDARRGAHPATLAEACRRWQVTLLVAVPALVGMVSAAAKGQPLRFGPLRQVAVTGSMLGRIQQSEGQAAFGAPIQVYYGLTETGGVCLVSPPGPARAEDGDVGLPAGALARIVDERGEPVEAGAAGELQIYSGNLTLGYFADADRSAALFDRGWLRTGDLARWSGAGRVILVGRKDEQIKNRFGEILHPAVVEAALYRRADVAEAAVVGLGDGTSFKLTAFVVPKARGGAQWLAQLQNSLIHDLGPRQTPDHFVERTALPRLSSGKIARNKLRDQARSG